MNKGKRAVAIISVLVLVCAIIYVVFVLFQVREIRVSGCVALTEKQVEELSGIEYGQCIFFVDKQAVMDALASDPAVKPISVNVVYPYSVEINIAERAPAAYIDTGGMRLTIDCEGVLLSVDMSPEGEALPQVAGISTARFEVGQPLDEDAYKRSVLCSLLGALRDSELDIVLIELNYTSALKVVTKEGLTIELGDETGLENKFALARYAMDELAQRGQTSGILDVATGVSAYYREN